MLLISTPQVALVSSIFMFGCMIGASIYGILADKLGRRLAVFLSVVNTTVAGMAGVWVHSYVWYCMTRFLAGVGKNAKYVDVL